MITSHSVTRNPYASRLPTASARTAAPESVAVDSAASPTRRRIGAVGLALAAVTPLFLSGCGPAPSTPPNNNTTNSAPANTNSGAAVTLKPPAQRTAQLDELSKSNRKAFLQLSADTYFEKVLTRADAVLPRDAAGQYSGAPAQAVGKITSQALQMGAQQTDPIKLDANYREALDALTRLPGDDAMTERFRQLSKAALLIGDQVVASDDVSNPTDYIAGTKVTYYEKALQKITTIPDEAKNRSGVDIPTATQYLGSLADEAQDALDTGPQINDFKTKSALYEATLRNLGDRMRSDQNEITNKYGAVIDKALQWADQLKNIWGK